MGHGANMIIFKISENAYFILLNFFYFFAILHFDFVIFCSIIVKEPKIVNTTINVNDFLIKISYIY